MVDVFRTCVTLPLQLLFWASVMPPSAAQAPLDAASVPKPQSLGFPPSLGLGDLAIASCFVKAGARNTQKLTLSWTKDGRELVSDERIEVHTTSGSGGTTLSIRNLQPDDVGNYTCTVWSAEGSQDVTVPLLVFVCWHCCSGYLMTELSYRSIVNRDNLSCWSITRRALRPKCFVHSGNILLQL
ncbi:hypothetical protein V5799_008402 [Amblyomma americanum]|uniref:Ig-like domain-containing protein n=1 Tax=Amblyomma americanum TaxID=6943 RepID=A0AAQ4FDC2_AMBAM